MLALQNHDHGEEGRTYLTGTPAELETQLTRAVSFTVKMPEVCTRLDLIDGTSCTLGAAPAALTRWRGPEGRYSLFQFQPADFGMKRAEGKIVTCLCGGTVHPLSARGHGLLNLGRCGPLDSIR